MGKYEQLIDESWHEHLTPLLQSEGFSDIKKNILRTNNFLPKDKDIFNVFKMPLSNIKVVILGQDPYPTPGDAIGYAFAVSESTKKPPSLRMIEKELGHEVDKTLKPWIEQGVFLLNTALTVAPGDAGSHIRAWAGFTARLIRIISNEAAPIWLLWGNYARSFKPIIEKSKRPQYILEAAHPAAEVYRANAGFLGCNHFEKVNAILSKKFKEQIKF